MRLIDADELYKRAAEWEEQAQDEVNKNKGCRTVEEWDKYREWLIILNERSSFKYDIADAPTIEAEPIKHGKWEHYKTEVLCDDIMGGEYSFKFFRCSECHFDVGGNNGFRYCPNCGAQMMDEVEE